MQARVVAMQEKLWHKTNKERCTKATTICRKKVGKKTMKSRDTHRQMYKSNINAEKSKSKAMWGKKGKKPIKHLQRDI